MTRSERTALYINSMVGPSAIAFAAIDAGINQARNLPDEWGQSAGAYGKRFASTFGQHAIQETVQSGIALGFHEDNRYFLSGEQGFKNRLWYAISSAFAARHDDGSRHISFSAFGGVASGAFISRLWLPASANTAGDGAVSFGIAMGIRAGMNVAREFIPLARRFTR